jgi:hypothetical protein
MNCYTYLLTVVGIGFAPLAEIPSKKFQTGFVAALNNNVRYTFFEDEDIWTR